MKMFALGGDKTERMTMKRSVQLLLVASIFPLAAACVRASEVPESTSTPAPADREIIARSADGLFEVIIPAGALSEPTEVVITTLRDQRVSDAAGPVYEVSTSNGAVLRSAAQARAHAPEGAWFAIVFVLPGEVTPLSGAGYDPVQKIATGIVRELNHARYALVAAPYTPCAQAACGTPCSLCSPDDASCFDPAGGVCGNHGLCTSRAVDCSIPEGWSDAIGGGQAFALGQIAIAGADRTPNALWPVGQLANDQIRQGLLGGETLLFFEVTGLDAAYRGDDRSVTLRLLTGRDFDDPFFPANNFKIPPGHTTCCEFLVDESATDDNRHAKLQASGSISRGRLEAEGLGGLTIPLAGPFLPLTRIKVSARLSPESLSGEMTAVVPFSHLARIARPFCGPSPCPSGSSMLQFVASLLHPTSDVDVDLDGFESVEDTDGDQVIDRCIDGDGTIVPAIDPLNLESCVFDPRITDGFSVVVLFEGTRAFLRGIDRVSGTLEMLSYHASDGTLYLRLFGVSVNRASAVEVATSRGKHTFLRRTYETSVDLALPNIAAGELIEIGTFGDPLKETATAQLRFPAPPIVPAYDLYVCCPSADTCQTVQDAAAGLDCPIGTGAINCTTDQECDEPSHISVTYSPLLIDAARSGDEIRIEARVEVPGGTLFELRSANETTRTLLKENEGTFFVRHEHAEVVTARMFFPDGTSSRPIDVQVRLTR